LQITTREQTAGLTFLNIQEAYKPTRTGTPNVVEATKDIVAWEQHHPYLQTSKPEPVTVGGVKGVQFDVVVGDLPQNYYSPICTSIVGTPNCADLFRLSTGEPILLVEGEKAGVIVLEDLEGETVTIGFSSPAGEFGGACARGAEGTRERRVERLIVALSVFIHPSAWKRNSAKSTYENLHSPG
jgi:hypothetical protein